MNLASASPSVEFSSANIIGQARSRRLTNPVGVCPQYPPQTPLPVGGQTHPSFIRGDFHTESLPATGHPPPSDYPIGPSSVEMQNQLDGVNSVNFLGLHAQPTAGVSSQRSLTTPLDIVPPLEYHQTRDIGYDSSYYPSPNTSLYSATQTTVTLQEGFQNIASTLNNMNHSLRSTTHYHPSQHSELHGANSFHHSLSPSHPTTTLRENNITGPAHWPVAEQVDLSTNRLITSNVHVNVSVTTGQLATTDSNPALPPSSIPMSNGHSPSVVNPVIPGSVETWRHHLVVSSPLMVAYSPANGNASKPHPDATRIAPTSRGVRNNSGQASPTLANVQQPLKVSEEATKKKKSKMHACPICAKQFPRPSGLHTHMNTHNNIKPYACIFPGCHRMFGVRSNAKRHLRTHGISPSALPPSPGRSPLMALTSEKRSAASAEEGYSQPYVVSFHEPIIVENLGVRTPGGGVATGGRSGEASNGQTRKDLGGGSRDGGHVPSINSSPPFFKLRWLPLSLTSRTGVATLKNARVKGVGAPYEDDENNTDEREGSNEGSSSEGRSDWQSYTSSPRRDGSYDEGQSNREETNEEVKLPTRALIHEKERR